MFKNSATSSRKHGLGYPQKDWDTSESLAKLMEVISLQKAVIKKIEDVTATSNINSNAKFQEKNNNKKIK